MANLSVSKKIALTLTPPGPVSEKVRLEVRGCVWNHDSVEKSVRLVLSHTGMSDPIWAKTVSIPVDSCYGVSHWVSLAGLAGEVTFQLRADTTDDSVSCTRTLKVVAADTLGLGRLGGAWIGFYHWSDEEAAKWNPLLREFTDADWRDVIRGMHRVEQNTVVIQQSWYSPAFYGRDYHQMDETNYREMYAGKAFYPSGLWSGRMDLPVTDPIEAVLDEADCLDMNVFMGLGLYAFFDYTSGSLAWHKDVAAELWERYGHHPSFYGWYISEELSGRIKPHEMRYWDATETFRREVVTFFHELRAYCDTFAPHTVIMLAPGAGHQEEADEIWPQLAESCNIFCVQGYQRAPQGRGHEESIAVLQQVCEQAGSHLWMDSEIFAFEHPDKDGPQTEGYSTQLADGTEAFVHVPLIPHRTEHLIESLNRFRQLEFIIGYQYPGIMTAPEAKKKLGGADAVRYFLEYEDWLARLNSGDPGDVTTGGNEERQRIK